jgi:hypothetical protein
MGGFFGSIPSVAISDSTVAGRTLLTSSTTQGLRTAIDTFVSAVTLGAFPASGNLQRIYLALDTAKTYVWNGSSYTEASPNTHTRAGTNNTNVGETALASSSLSGNNNTAVGSGALQFNQTGSNCVGVGSQALITNSGGANNTAVGSSALVTNTGGGSNSGFGANALLFNTNGEGNTAIGYNAVRANQVGAGNVGVGFHALISTLGGFNTGIGAYAGDSIISGTNNTIIGIFADVDSGGRNNCVVLGNSTISPAVDGSLSIGGTGGNAMGNIVTASGGTSASQDLIIYLNGTRYRIALKT